MPNYQGVWSLSTQYQNASGWPLPPPVGFLVAGEISGNSRSDVVTRVLLTSGGSVSDFGDMAQGQGRPAGCSSTTRGIIAGGQIGLTTKVDVIQSLEFGSTGSGSDFGDLTLEVRHLTGASNATRGLFSGGEIIVNSQSVDSNTIAYITIASAGNAADFGDLTQGRDYLASTSSPTRVVIGGGRASGTKVNTMDYVDIASLGNASDFGDLTVARSFFAAVNSSTRGVFAGGRDTSNATVNTMDYVTLASTGNAVDFGDMISGLATFSGTYFSTNVQGYLLPRQEKITIASTGNSVQAFTDLDSSDFVQVGEFAGMTGSHGGLQ